MVPDVALMVAEPVPTVVANPAILGALATVATFAFDEPQCALMETSCVEASLKVPVAVYCTGVPTLTFEFAGVTAMLDNVALLTVREVVPVMPPDFAVIVTVPNFLPCAKPVGLMLTTEGLDDFQVTPARLELVLLSLKVPIAVNLMNVPLAMCAFAGDTAMD